MPSGPRCRKFFELPARTITRALSRCNPAMPLLRSAAHTPLLPGMDTVACLEPDDTIS